MCVKEKKTVDAYAIDFGTSNSLMGAASTQSCLSLVPLDEENKDKDNTILKSLFYTRDLVNWSFGNKAISEYVEWGNEGRLFRSLKRFLPEPHFKGTIIADRFVKIEELISVFLRHMRVTGNAHFEQDVDRVVMGRPALFSLDPIKDQIAQNRLHTAAKMAGFKDIIFCKEPVAAALDFSEHLQSEKKVLIADFGGGTSDFTVVKMRRGPLHREDVLALGGVSLAGDAFDGALMRDEVAPFFGTEVIFRLPMGKNLLRLPIHLVDRLCSPSGIMFLNQQDILEYLRHAQYCSLHAIDQERMNRLFTLIEEQLGYHLFRSIETLKIELGMSDKATFNFDYPGIEITEEISSANFGTTAESLVEKIMSSLDETLKNGQLTYDDIDLVCMTGGTAKLPAIQEVMKLKFTKEKLVSYRHFHSITEGLTQMAHRWVRGETIF